MGSDMVVALGRATVDAHTLFGQNCSRAAGSGLSLCLTPKRQFTLGEKLRTDLLEILQSRQVYQVLGNRPGGRWGYIQGINENRVAAGCLSLPAALPCPKAGLTGTDLVRLILERSSSARQAVELFTDLMKQHGQGSYPGCPAEFDHDNAFLIADPVEAYAVETAGPYWVCQEIREVRAVSNVRVVHQDWDHISCGLASYAIEHGWWPEDGSKLDFASALTRNRKAQVAGMRRWGRATMLLHEQNGHIDPAFLRRLLSDHAEERAEELLFFGTSGNSESICQHPRGRNITATAASFIAELDPDPAEVSVVWCAFGAPCTSVYFPVFLDGELPDAFIHHDDLESTPAGFGRRMAPLMDQAEPSPGRLERTHEAFARLQALLDQETEEFLQEATALKKNGSRTDLQRQISLFMEYNLEKFEGVYAEVTREATQVAVGK